MERSYDVKMFLSLFAVNVPTLLVCLVAGVVIMGRWRYAQSAAFWAALGFGLVLILCFVMPFGQMMLQRWVFEGGQRQTRMWAFTAFGIVGSVLHAVIYALLLAAIYAGRPKAANVT
jgi:hypothetical protein